MTARASDFEILGFNFLTVEFAAVFAARRFVAETFLFEKILFASGPGEILAALFALEDFVLEFHVFSRYQEKMVEAIQASATML